MSETNPKVIELDQMEPWAAHQALVALRDRKLPVTDVQIRTRAFAFTFGNTKARDTFIDALNVKNGNKPGAIVVTGVELRKHEDAQPEPRAKPQPKQEAKADAERAAKNTKLDDNRRGAGGAGRSGGGRQP